LAVNGAGFVTANPNVDTLFRLLSGAAAFDASRIINVYGDKGPEIVAQDWYLQQSGAHLPLFIESQVLFTFGHGVAQLTDSAGLYDFFIRLDNGLRTSSPEITLPKLKALFDAASAQADVSLEWLVDSLVRLFGLDFTPLSGSVIGDREALYQRVLTLGAVATNMAATNPGMTVDVLANILPGDLVSIAQGSTAFGYRYALTELNPFAILGDNSIYDIHNQNGELTLYDPATRTGTLTEDWIKDRAGLLQAVLTSNTQDNPDIARIPGFSDISTTYEYYAGGKERVVFADPVDRLPAGQQREQVVMFGDDAGRSLVGTNYVLGDRLYGGANTDYLIGKAGDDYLEGGKGLDIYQYNVSGTTGDGADTIRDTDGKGVLRYSVTQGGFFSRTVQGTVIADASVRASGIAWNSADGKFSYIRSQNDLIVTINDGTGGRITLKDFRDGDFNIHLREARNDPDITGVTIAGDLQPQDFDPDTPGIQTRTDELGNVIVTTNPEPDRVDLLNDSTGNDRIIAVGGNDIVRGIRGGDDWFSGDAGRDDLQGGAGADLIEGGADGVYNGEAGGDIAYGDIGNDALYADGKIELVQAISLGIGSPGTNAKGEFLGGGGDEDWIIGAAGNDYLDGGSSRDLIIGGAGDDDITGDYGFAATTPLWVVRRATTQQGDMTVHSLNFDAGSVWVDLGLGASDVIYAGAGVDWVAAGDGDDYADAGPDDDKMWGEAGSDILIGGEGHDLLVGDNPTIVTGAAEGADYLDGGAGNDKLEGDGGNDVLIGGTGIDTLSGGAGKDIYVFNKGDGTEAVFDADTSANNPDASVLVLGDGVSAGDIRFRTGSLAVDLGPSDISDPSSPRDVIHFYGFSQIDPVASTPLAEIRFSDGSGMSYDDILARGFDIDGTAGDDTGQQNLVGTGVVDRIRGFAGNDLLFGLRGDDMLDGADGVDQLVGGPGNDTFYGGLEHDEIWGDGESGGIFEPDGADVVYAGGANDYVEGDGGNDQLFGDEGSDQLYGEDGADVVEGGADNDYLYGQGYYWVLGTPHLNLFDDDAADTLRGGDGDDYLNAAGGADVLEGGAGSDNLEAEAGADYLAGGDGNDFLWGDKSDATVAGDDTLDGGAGNDQLVGYKGDDTYLFGRSYGQDIVFDNDATAGNIDRVVFADDITPDHVSAVQSGSSLVLSIGGTTDTLTLANHFLSTADRIEEIRFADGTVWTPAATPLSIRGTSGNDVLNGTSGPNIFEGLAGNDTMSGGAGNDSYRIFRGDGADVITDFDSTPGNLDRLVYGADILPSEIQLSRSGSNLVLRRSGSTDQVTITNYLANDGATPNSIEEIRFLTDGTLWDVATVKSMLLNGTNGNDVITGYASGDVLSGLGGNDTLSGNAGDDTLDGGPGNDFLQGGSGNDTYLLARGHGQDLVSDVDATAGNTDRIVYADDIASADVQAARAGNDLVLKLNGSPDQITVSGYFVNDGANTSLIERVEFADDTVWDLATIKAMLITPTDGNDEITGYATDDVLSGLAGNDTLRGAAGNDTLNGGAGNDFLYGEGGADLYLFARGDGQDTIENASFDGAGTNDILAFADDILPGDITPSRSGRDLVLAINGSTDHARILNYFSSGTSVVEQIRFANGTVWNEQTMLALLPPPPIVGTDGNDILSGTPSGELIRGLGGDDTLRGLGGNDTFEGGPGEDIVQGGAENDTYLFGLGDGGPPSIFILGDDISDAGGYDVLRFGSGITPTGFDVIEQTDARGHMLVLKPAGTNAGVYIIGYFSTGHIEEIQFEDGTVWTDQTIAPQLPRLGTAANENMTGTMIADLMYGFDGNDTINGSSGHDTIDGGGGADNLYGGFGNDILISGGADKASDNLYGGPGDDVLIGQSYLDHVYGEAGNDILFGTGGAKDLIWLEDELGKNAFIGGASVNDIWSGDQNDLIVGGTANDRIDGDRDRDGLRGRDVILFNKTDGTDSYNDVGLGSTISIGGGALYSNLSLVRNGTGLTLKVGNSSIGLDWYGQPEIGIPANRSISTLQIVIEGTRDYKPGSTNPMNNRKIQVFDFQGLVAAFDAAQAAGQRFNVAANLANHWLWSSDTEAIGGALAYQYARTGSVSALSYDEMRAVISAPEFGVSAQPIGSAVSATASDATGGDAMAASLAVVADQMLTDDEVNADTSLAAAASITADADTVRLSPRAAEHVVPPVPRRTPAIPEPVLQAFMDDAPGTVLVGPRAAPGRETPRPGPFASARGGAIADETGAHHPGSGRDAVQSLNFQAGDGSGPRSDADDALAEWFARSPSDDDLSLLDDIARGDLPENYSVGDETIARAWRKSHWWLNRRLHGDAGSGDDFEAGAMGYTLFGDSGMFADLPRPTVGLQNVAGHQFTRFSGLAEGSSVLRQWTGAAG